jgi:hypothetical protein
MRFAPGWVRKRKGVTGIRSPLFAFDGELAQAGLHRASLSNNQLI